MKHCDAIGEGCTQQPIVYIRALGDTRGPGDDYEPAYCWYHAMNRLRNIMAHAGVKPRPARAERQGRPEPPS